MIGFNNKKIGFIVDTSSNIDFDQFDDVKVVPLCITVQNKSGIKTYKECIDFNREDLINAFKDKDNIIKTSQAALPDMMKAADEMCSKYDQVYVLPIHDRISSNINSWKLLKDDYPNLNVVMSCDIGHTFIWTIDLIKEYLKTHEGNEEIIQKFIEDNIYPNRFGLLMVEDMEQLKKGGRVSTAKAIIAKIFKIKPIILMNREGLMSYDRGKDYDDWIGLCPEHIKKAYPGKELDKIMLFFDLKDEQLKDQILTTFKRYYPDVTPTLVYFPFIVTCHTGLKRVGLYVNLKDRK